MLLKRLIDGFSRSLSKKKGGIALLSGAAAVLAGVQQFMTPRKPRTDYFSIRRTQSELGYTYWVLQGHGYFSSFTLFDTWREAMDEATLRVRQIPRVRPSVRSTGTAKSPQSKPARHEYRKETVSRSYAG